MDNNQTKRIGNRRSNLPIVGEVVYIRGLLTEDSFDPAKIEKRGGVVKMLDYKTGVHLRLYRKAVDYMLSLAEFADGYKAVGMESTVAVSDYSAHIEQLFEALEAVETVSEGIPTTLAQTPQENVPGSEKQPALTLELAEVMAWLNNPNAVNGLTLEQVLELTQALQMQLGYIVGKVGLLHNEATRPERTSSLLGGSSLLSPCGGSQSFRL